MFLSNSIFDYNHFELAMMNEAQRDKIQAAMETTSGSIHWNRFLHKRHVRFFI